MEFIAKYIIPIIDKETIRIFGAANIATNKKIISCISKVLVLITGSMIKELTLRRLVEYIETTSSAFIDNDFSKLELIREPMPVVANLIETLHVSSEIDF